MRKNLRNRILGASLAALLVLPAGCATNPDGTTEYKRTAIGALAGGAVGAGAGALIGGKRAGRGALIGGVTGAVVGGAIGNYMDRQAAELKRRLPDAAVERQGDKLYVALPSGILFDVDKDQVRPEAKQSLTTAADVLIKYPDTYVTVEGHTDSTGSNEHNQSLSERRAMRVRDVLADSGVPPQRLSARGYGETDPISDNSTPEGRQLNRRVQLEIRPNEKLQAQQKQGG
ncbi:MAG: OmpA family outer membrane lipoprotein [Deltaproteobacteria bacterium CSP1-8]|jgi:outer membrane protein OmpA-like peptidoglycan-associated protein|nr:MAG: OmpA family outer membrane lipoprotein [Deltaproteobacteria bacterium CSP1-8]